MNKVVFKNFSKGLILLLLGFMLIGLVSANEDINETLDNNFNDPMLKLENNYSIEVYSNNNLEENLSLNLNDVSFENESQENLLGTSEYDKVYMDAPNITIYYCSQEWFQVKVTDYWGNLVDGGYVKFNYGNRNYNVKVIQGYATEFVWAANELGAKTVTLSYVSNSHYSPSSMNLSFKTVKVNVFTTCNDYKYGTNKFKFYLYPVDGGYGVSGVKVKVKVKVGKKYKTFYKTTDKKGCFALKIKKLSAGYHNIIVKSLTKNVKVSYGAYLCVDEAKVKIKTYSSGKYIKIKAKNSKGKVVKGLKIKVKLYTGKHYKKVTVKTNKKGIAKVYVAGLSSGVYHKVKYSSANKNYYLKKISGANTDYVMISKGKALPLWWLP